MSKSQLPATGAGTDDQLLEAARAELEASRERCEEAGGGCSIMAAVALCGTHDIAMPGWLSDAFIRMRSRVVDGEVTSWDEAIGRAWPRGARPAAARRKKVLKARIHAAVWRRVKGDPTVRINRLLFDEIGELPEICSGGSKVATLYYEAIKEGSLNIATWRVQAALSQGPEETSNILVESRELS
jgi:hypothetical protein